MEIKLQNTRLGNILLEQALVTEAQLEAALAAQEASGTPLGKILIEEKVITEAALAKALAVQKNLELVDLDDFEIEPAAAALISLDIANRYKLIPIRVRGGKLVVAMANPLDVYALDTVQLATGMRVELVVATGSAVEAAITQYMSEVGSLQETMLEAVRVKADDGPVVEIVDDVEIDEDVPVVKLARQILTQAFKMRASDVHIENEEHEVKVRFRIDGVLKDEMTIPGGLRSLLVSRFKIMGDMDIAERRRPQDGRVVINVDHQPVQLRVASFPTMFGENMTIRLLTTVSGQLGLEGLGLEESVLETYRGISSRSWGAVINTGPTGSGKTTTLYATLAELNTRARKIITVEDPVECAMPGVSQMQINRKAGLDFAGGLRAILRADPDIVMVGEIRDLETAQMAVRAALTGHLVFSSLHTNDAAGALTRLIDMGVDPFLVTSAIRGILAQRLGRLLCPHCKKAVVYDREQLRLLGVETEADEETFYQPGQCRRCDKSGYKGRVGIYEFLVVSEEINRLCIDRASSAAVKEQAIKEGMRTLYVDGVAKARSGIISLEEMRRVVL